MGANYFISGIGTDVGKTLVSAILTEALKADYWKPVQAGNRDQPDHAIVASLISNPVSVIHPPSYSLMYAASPHYAAEMENINISLEQIQIPVTENRLIIEGAGGLMVPLNKKELVIDLIRHLNAEVILVVKNYLGAINHALLSIEALKHQEIPVAGIIYNGGNRAENIHFIENYSKISTLGIIPDLEVINKEQILTEAAKFAGLKVFS